MYIYVYTCVHICMYTVLIHILLLIKYNSNSIASRRIPKISTPHALNKVRRSYRYVCINSTASKLYEVLFTS